MKLGTLILSVTLCLFVTPMSASAMSIDWSGYFRADHNLVHNYQMDRRQPGNENLGLGGEYIAGEGSKSTAFSSVFLKLKPKMLVNDNVIIRSEWNVGDPVSGFFGRSIPREDRTVLFSSGRDGMDLSVARLWLDVHTDFGTLQVGRAPFHWGLGAIFNSGDQPFDRYQSTSDTIRLISKFGYLSLMPLYAKQSMGRNLAGARNPISDQVMGGSDDITDYGLALRYDNPEEEIDGGIMFYKRNAPDTQTSFFRPGQTQFSPGANGMNMKLLNIYAKKSWKRWEVGAEIPIFRGDVMDINGVGSRNTYSATAFILEGALKFDTWRHSLKAGSVPGQESATTGNRGKNFGALSLHRSYKLGQIMFGYNLGSFGGANPDAIPGDTTVNRASVSPYDAAITNARYLMLSSEKNWEQWGMNIGLVWAQANQTAVTGRDAFNHRTRNWFTSVTQQGSNLGIEAGFGTRYRWDDNISFGSDISVLFPGSYFKYLNSVTRQSSANAVSALTLSASASF
jgi:hypothetical protein